MTDHTDVSEAEQAAQEGVGSGDEGYSGPEPTDGLTADDCTLTCERADCPTVRFSGPAGASITCERTGCGKAIGASTLGVPYFDGAHPGPWTARPHVPPFTPLPGRVLTQLTHEQIGDVLHDLPPEELWSEEDKITANVLGYALKQPEAPREDGDWGYKATGPVDTSLVTCRICGHVHDPEDGRCDVHAYVGIGCCPCPGEAALADLVDSAQRANDAMRSHNRGGTSWLELDGAFAAMEAAIKRVRFVTRADS